MLIKELIQRVQSLYSKGVQSDDSRLSARHIYSVIQSVRSTLLTQRADKRQPISQWNYQTLNCVELIKAKPYECPCLPAIGCTILRTKEPLPKPLTGLIDGHLIQSVTSLEGSITYSPTTWEDKKYKKGAKYTSTKPDYYIRDNYLYITTKTGPKAITITGIFDDPLEVDSYPGLCDEVIDCAEDCIECKSPLDMNLPIDRDMVKTLVEMSANELLSLFSQGREDLTNNSRDNLKQESK